MTLASLLAALALEHWRPQTLPLRHYQAFAAYSAYLREKLDGSETSHGWLGWCAAVLPLMLAVWLLGAMLSGVWTPLGWAWGVCVLYFTIGFKYYTLLAENIAAAIRRGDNAQAWSLLQAWRGPSASPQAGGAPTAGEIAGQTIERLISHSLRQTFGVLFWFALLGPAGAVLYRASSILSRRWLAASAQFHQAAGSIFHALNWLPARLAGLTYAMVGNFEDAMYCWRTQVRSWPEPDEAVVLCAGAGSMGVRLGRVSGEVSDETGHGEALHAEAGLGDEPEADQIDSAVSMIWRGLMVWLIVGLLLVVAGWANA